MSARSSRDSQEAASSVGDLGAMGRTATSRLKVTYLVVVIFESVDIMLLREDRRGWRREIVPEVSFAGSILDLLGSEKDEDEEAASFFSEFCLVNSRLHRRKDSTLTGSGRRCFGGDTSTSNNPSGPPAPRRGRLT